jgi:hypothetical protein
VDIAGMGTQILVFGIVGLWLLAVVPAAAITALKEQWLLLGWGWLTLGIVWLIGAASPAPRGSPWARWFYDEEKLARAENPMRYPRDWRNLGVGIGVGLGLIAVLGFFAARPTPILGVEGRPLQSSVGNSGFLSFPTTSCQHLRSDEWSCQRWDDQYSSTISYTVEVNRLGCWTATRTKFPGEGSAKHLSGCVTILDWVSR